MLTIADYTSPLGKQIREYVYAEMLEAFQRIREDRHIPLDSEADAIRLYLEVKLEEVRPSMRVAV